MPVLVPGAKFFAGDPHYAQDGPYTLEAPLRATFRLSVLPRGTALAATEPAGYRLPRTRLDLFVKRRCSESLSYLAIEHAMPRALAFAYLAAAAPVRLAQQALLAQLASSALALLERLEAHAPRIAGAFVNWMSR